MNVVHNPQSNCNNAVGTAKLPELMRRGVRVGLGSDGYSPRMWDEFKTAFHVQKLRAGDPRVGYAEAYAAAFLNNRDNRAKSLGHGHRPHRNRRRAPTSCWSTISRPTPLVADNLFGHLLFGISNAPVDIADRERTRRRSAIANASPWTSAPSPKKRPSRPDPFGEDSKTHANINPRTDLPGDAGPAHAAGRLPRDRRRGPRRRTRSRPISSTSPGARRMAASATKCCPRN